MKLNKSEKAIKENITMKGRSSSYFKGAGFDAPGDKSNFIPYSILKGTIMKAILFKKEPKIEYFKEKKKFETREIPLTKNMHVLVKTDEDTNTYLIKNDEIKEVVNQIESENKGIRLFELPLTKFLATIIHDIAPLDDDYGYYVFGNIDDDGNARFVDFDQIIKFCKVIKIYEGSMTDEKKPEKFIDIYTHI